MAVEHVVVLCMENRSFDHMLGFLPHPDPAFEGLLRGGPYENPGYDGGPAVPASSDAKAVLPVGPDHSHDAVMAQLGVTGSGSQRRCTNQGFVASYELKGRREGPDPEVGILPWLRRHLLRGQAPAPAPVTGVGPLVMRCQDPDRIPVLRTLALEFAVFDHWFCSVPGETWPNRNFLHAATSDGETDIEIRPYTNRTIFEVLEEHGSTWHVYHDDTPQVWAFPALWDTPERHANWFETRAFAEHVAAGSLPTYSFIEPNHRPPLHTLDHTPALGGLPDVSDSQHPENGLVSAAAYDGFDDRDLDTDFDRGERLIATVYEALRAAPELFATTLLLITYDEHGGLYDHVAPPTDVAPPGGHEGGLAPLAHALEHHEVSRFDFRMLGPRVPAVLVSPLVPRGTLVRDDFEHASVPATLRRLFAPEAAPLTERDAHAGCFDTVASLGSPRADLPDLSGHLAAPVRAAEPEPFGAPDDGSRERAVPEYYREFLRQADLVRHHLRRVGEPEIGETHGIDDDVDRGVAVSAAFRAAAGRHRSGRS